jgi:hypothetical protein
MSKTRRAELGTTGVFANDEAGTPTHQQPPAAARATATPKAATARPDREGRAAMPFWTTVAAKRQLRILAAELDTTQQDLMTAALNDLFTRHGKPPIA